MKRIYSIFFSFVLFIVIRVCGAENSIIPLNTIFDSDEDNTRGYESQITPEEIAGFLNRELPRWKNQIITNEWIGRGKKIPTPSKKIEGKIEEIMGNVKGKKPQFEISAGVPFQVYTFNEIEFIKQKGSISSSIVPSDIWYAQIFINSEPSSIIKISTINRKKPLVIGYGLYILAEMLAEMEVFPENGKKFVMSSHDDAICFITDEEKKLLYPLPITKKTFGIADSKFSISPDVLLYKIQEKQTLQK